MMDFKNININANAPLDVMKLLSWFFLLFLQNKKESSTMSNYWMLEGLQKYNWMDSFIWVHMAGITHWNNFFCSENVLPVFFHSSSQSCLSVKWKAQHPSVEQPRSSHWRRWDEQQCCPFLSRTSITTWLVVHLASALTVNPFQGTELSSEVYYGPI